MAVSFERIPVQHPGPAILCRGLEPRGRLSAVAAADPDHRADARRRSRHPVGAGPRHRYAAGLWAVRRRQHSRRHGGALPAQRQFRHGVGDPASRPRRGDRGRADRHHHRHRGRTRDDGALHRRRALCGDDRRRRQCRDDRSQNRRRGQCRPVRLGDRRGRRRGHRAGRARADDQLAATQFDAACRCGRSPIASPTPRRRAARRGERNLHRQKYGRDRQRSFARLELPRRRRRREHADRRHHQRRRQWGRRRQRRWQPRGRRRLARSGARHRGDGRRGIRFHLQPLHRRRRARRARRGDERRHRALGVEPADLRPRLLGAHGRSAEPGRVRPHPQRPAHLGSWASPIRRR